MSSRRALYLAGAAVALLVAVVVVVALASGGADVSQPERAPTTSAQSPER